jgi:extradiol dioxygenase family protein
MSSITPFHSAIAVNDLEAAKTFYVNLFDCKVGRSSENWVDLNFFGHQLVLHLDKKKNKTSFNSVDNKEIPIPHYGVILSWDDWHKLAHKTKDQNIDFLVEPYIRFKDLPGEQATMFFLDPSGNALEFKAFQNMDNIFKEL